jgi:hypothetical protein
MLSQRESAVQLGTNAKRLLWICTEVGIGLLVVWICYFWATQKPNFPISAKWVGFILCTLVLFGYPIYWGRKELSGKSFWVYWLLFLCLHAAVIGSFVARAHGVPLVLFAAIGIGEAALMNPIFLKIQMRENVKNRKG